MGTRFAASSANRVVKPTAATTFPIIINGDFAYAGAPARDQSAQYPMENLFSASRYMPWSTRVGTAAGALKLQLDLSGGSVAAGAGGVDKLVSAAGIFALRGHAGVLPPTTIGVGYRTRAQGYSATGYTNVITLGPGGTRDSAVVLASPVSARYWEFDFAFYDVAGFSCKLWLPSSLTDLGIIYSPGAVRVPEQNILQSRTAGGHVTNVSRGDPWERVSMSFAAISDALKVTLDGLFSESNARDPYVWVDHAGRVRQVALVPGGLRLAHRYSAGVAGDSVWDVSLELEVLG